MTAHTPDEIKATLANHALWLRSEGGARADLTDAYLRGADLAGADLTNANLTNAYLRGADLTNANLTNANLTDAYLRGADLAGSRLVGAIGNMREIRSMQIDTWPVAYTAEHLQIGCQIHAIDKWRKWDTDAGRNWIAMMDIEALAWADRNLALVLQIIEANPATPTGHEKEAAE